MNSLSYPSLNISYLTPDETWIFIIFVGGNNRVGNRMWYNSGSGCLCFYTSITLFHCLGIKMCSWKWIRIWIFWHYRGSIVKLKFSGNHMNIISLMTYWNKCHLSIRLCFVYKSCDNWVEEEGTSLQNIKDAIEKKLGQPKTKEESKEMLQKYQDLLVDVEGLQSTLRYQISINLSYN